MSSPQPPQRGSTMMDRRGAVMLLAWLIGICAALAILDTIDPQLPQQLDQLGNWIQGWSNHCHFSCPAR